MSILIYAREWPFTEVGSLAKLFVFDTEVWPILQSSATQLTEVSRMRTVKLGRYPRERSHSALFAHRNVRYCLYRYRVVYASTYKPGERSSCPVVNGVSLIDGEIDYSARHEQLVVLCWIART